MKFWNLKLVKSTHFYSFSMHDGFINKNLNGRRRKGNNINLQLFNKAHLVGFFFFPEQLSGRVPELASGNMAGSTIVIGITGGGW